MSGVPRRCRLGTPLSPAERAMFEFACCGCGTAPRQLADIPFNTNNELPDCIAVAATSKARISLSVRRPSTSRVSWR